MEVQEFTAPERRISKAAAMLREQGVTDGQLAWCATLIDRERIATILNGEEAAWREFVRAGAATERDEERRAYVGLAATQPGRLRKAFRIEHPKRPWPAAKVRAEVARLRDRGVSDEELAAAIPRVGLRPVAEAPAGRDNLGWWARGQAIRAATRELALAYLTVAAAPPSRVRKALHDLGVEVARRALEARRQEASAADAPAVARDQVAMAEVAS
jgi:hypothetical protein